MSAMFPFTKPNNRRAQILSLVFFYMSVGLVVWLVGFWIYINRLMLILPPPEAPKPVTYTQSQPVERVSPLLVQYRLDLPGRGEVFPALTAATAASDYWPLAILTITNTSKQPIVQVISGEVPDWSRRFQQSVVLGPQQTTALKVNPELLPTAFNNAEIAHAMLHLAVTDESGATMFAQSRPVLIHGGSDLYWGKQFGNAQVVARWVTPHDDAVLQLVSEAHAFVPNGRMPGYNTNTPSKSALELQVKRQAEAVFKALKRSGFSYVSSIFTFGGFAADAQRIRLPRETLKLDSANCMDISVAFASAIENLGMNPVVVIVPGHAFTGVRLGSQSSDILYLDLTVLPKGTFAQAQARAQQWLKKIPAEQVLTVDIASARRMGVYPLPGAGEQAPPQPQTATKQGAKAEITVAP
jgi:hypothetical protein